RGHIQSQRFRTRRVHTMTNKRLLFALLLLSVLLVACGGGETPAPADAAVATPAVATPAEATAPVAGESAITDEPAVDPSAAADAPADTGANPPADNTSADPAADAAVAAAAQAATQGPALVPGTDYIEIPGGQPFAPLEGKIGRAH